MQSEKIVELDNTKTYTTVVKKINGSNSKNVSVSLQKNVNTVAEAVTISPSSTGNYKSFTESDGLYRGWIYIPAETICNELEIEIMVLEGNYNLGNAPIYEKYGQTPSIEYKSSVEGITGDVNLKIKNKNYANNVTYLNQNSNYLPCVKCDVQYQKDQYYIVSFNTPNTGDTVYINQGEAFGIRRVTTRYSSLCDGSRKYYVIQALKTIDRKNVNYVNKTNEHLDISTGLLSDFMIEKIKASTDEEALKCVPSSFLENKESTVTISLGEKRLYKGDKIVRKNGKWYFNLKWNTINNFTNLFLEGLGGGSYRARLPLNNKIVNISHAYVNKSYSNILKCLPDGQTYNKIEGFTISSPSAYTTPQMFLYIKDFENYTKEQYIQALNNLQAYFVVPLKEEDLEEILDSTLINSLNKLLRIKQYEEVTNVEFDQDVIFEIDIDKSEIRILKETNALQNIEIEKLKENINYKDKIISGLQGGQVKGSVEGDNITIQDCLELPIKFDKIYGKEIQVESDFVELEYLESTGSQYIDTRSKGNWKNNN